MQLVPLLTSAHIRNSLHLKRKDLFPGALGICLSKFRNKELNSQYTVHSCRYIMKSCLIYYRMYSLKIPCKLEKTNTKVYTLRVYPNM